MSEFVGNEPSTGWRFWLVSTVSKYNVGSNCVSGGLHSAGSISGRVSRVDADTAEIMAEGLLHPSSGRLIEGCARGPLRLVARVRVGQEVTAALEHTTGGG